VTCIADAGSLTTQTITLSRKAAKEEAEKDRPGLTLWTGGFRMDMGAVGYAVVWRPRHPKQVWAVFSIARSRRPRTGYWQSRPSSGRTALG